MLFLLSFIRMIYFFFQFSIFSFWVTPYKRICITIFTHDISDVRLLGVSKSRKVLGKEQFLGVASSFSNSCLSLEEFFRVFLYGGYILCLKMNLRQQVYVLSHNLHKHITK